MEAINRGDFDKQDETSAWDDAMGIMTTLAGIGMVFPITLPLAPLIGLMAYRIKRRKTPWTWEKDGTPVYWGDKP
jgi:hypothetical protein